MMSDRHPARKFSRRELRGLAIVAMGGQVTKINETAFKVKSQTSDKIYHVVWVADRWTCNCADFATRMNLCKHIFAILYLTELEKVVSVNRFELKKRGL